MSIFGGVGKETERRHLKWRQRKQRSHRRRAQETLKPLSLQLRRPSPGSQSHPAATEGSLRHGGTFRMQKGLKAPGANLQQRRGKHTGSWRGKGSVLSLWPRLNLVLHTKYGQERKSKRVKVKYVGELSNKKKNIRKLLVIMLHLQLLDVGVAACFTVSGGIHGVFNTWPTLMGWSIQNTVNIHVYSCILLSQSVTVQSSFTSHNYAGEVGFLVLTVNLTYFTQHQMAK